MNTGVQRGICCTRCLAVSYQLQDVLNRHCGNCGPLTDHQAVIWSVPGTCPRCPDTPAARTLRRVQVDLGGRIAQATYTGCWHHVDYPTNACTTQLHRSTP